MPTTRVNCENCNHEFSSNYKDFNLCSSCGEVFANGIRGMIGLDPLKPEISNKPRKKVVRKELHGSIQS